MQFEARFPSRHVLPYVAFFQWPFQKFHLQMALRCLLWEAALVSSPHLSCRQRVPGAGEHKRMEISVAFVSAVEVAMTVLTVRCCRCVHVE